MITTKQYWEQFLDGCETREQYSNRSFTAWHFCDNQQDADELAELVRKGSKRGTASLKKSYISEGEALPQIGDISMILDWAGNPRCLIETIGVTEYPFQHVPAEFAAVEGEGDGSLDYWKRVHRRAFTREAAAGGFAFSEELTVICEEFRVIFPPEEPK